MSDSRDPHLPVTKQVIFERISNTRVLLLLAKRGERETDMRPEEIERVLGALDLAERVVLNV